MTSPSPMKSPDRDAADEDHKRIWLSPRCDEYDERTWCEDDRGCCDDCGAPNTEYIRADIQASELATLRGALSAAGLKLSVGDDTVIVDATTGQPLATLRRRAAEMGFQIGDAVEVTERCKYYADWKGAPLTVVGLRLDNMGRLDIAVSEHGKRTDKGTTDGFRETDLAASPLPPGRNEG